MKKNSKAAALLLAGALTLTGCGKSEPVEKTEEPVQTIVATQTETKEDIKEIKDPFTHYIEFYSYINQDNAYTNFDTYNQFGHESGFIESNLPVIEGYTVYDVEPITEKYGYGSRTVGFVYFLVNTDTVEVTGKYNYKDNTYHFSEPGTLYDVYGLELYN